MSALPKKKLTPAQYLLIEREAEFRSEFYNGEMFAMAGASPAHCDIKDNLMTELGARFKGGPCRARSNDQRVLVSATCLYTYPDIVIFCGPASYAPPTNDTLTNPTILIEVLSPSTENYDRTTKLMMYQQIESLKEYIMVAQDHPWCERIARQADGTWSLAIVAEMSGELAFVSVPIRIPLIDIYANVTFPENPDGRPAHPGS